MFHEPIHILGAGSIGMFWAASIRLAFPSYPVQLLLRQQHNLQKQRTICLLQHRRPRIVPDVPCGTAMSDKRTIRNLIVTTKAYDAVAAIQSVQHRLKEDTSRVILLCNGALAVADAVRREYPFANIYTGVTTHGVYQQQQPEKASGDDDDDDPMYTLVNNGQGHCYLDPTCDPMMRELWNAAGLDCRCIINEDMETLLWKKLAANCVINPLTAIHRCHNGELLSIDDVATTYDHVLDEIQQVYAASVHSNNPESPRIDFRDYVDQVLVGTAKNRSSMLQDVEQGRRTEIDFLNGFIVDQGAKHGIDCPVNRCLYETISNLTS